MGLSQDRLGVKVGSRVSVEIKGLSWGRVQVEIKGLDSSMMNGQAYKHELQLGVGQPNTRIIRMGVRLGLIYIHER